MNIYCPAKATIFRGIYTVAGNSVLSQIFILQRKSYKTISPAVCLYLFTFCPAFFYFLWLLILLFQLFSESLEAKEKGGSEGKSVSNDERNWKLEGLNFSLNFTVCQGQTCILDEWGNVISKGSADFSCLYSS